MSGKKNSEVAAVLRRGEDVRRMSDRTFNDQIEKDLKNFRQCMEKIKSIQSDAEKLNADVSAEAETMFGDKAKAQLKAFEDLKAALSKIKLNASEDKNIKSTLNDLDRQLWKRQKADAEGMLDEVEGLATFELVEPIDYYNEGADAQRTEMFDYINRYGGKDLRKGYQQAVDAARDLIRDEKFLEGIDKLKRASELVMEARDIGIKLQDSMLKKIELAGAIQDVMSDLRYQVGLSIVNDNPNDGFKLTCSIGDETINFDRVDIDADGKIIIDVDHHESVGGTCGATWKDISKRLNEEGIPVTDVLKGDRSVLHPERKVQPDGGTRQTAAG